MKAVNSVVAILSIIMLCGSLGSSVFAESIEENNKAVEKISDRLLEEYGVSRERLQTVGGRMGISQSTDKVPVFIWCANDIDHDVAENVALPVLLKDLSDGDRNDLSNIKTLEDICSSNLEPSLEAVQSFISLERSESRELYTNLNQDFINTYMPGADIAYVSVYSPVIIARLSLHELLNLSENQETVYFEYYGKEKEERTELSVSKIATNARQVQLQYGLYGEGINIGQVEYKVPLNGNVQLASIGIHRNTSNTSLYDVHPTIVACILSGASTANYPSGVAPGAELYCAATNAYSTNGDIEATEWLLTQNVNVINASFPFGGDSNNTYGSNSQWLDHIAKNHYVMFVKSAGNSGGNGVTSGGMAYNIVTVGNVDDNNTTSVSDDVINSSSSYYDGTALAYKPDICAPGTNICTSATTGAGPSGTSLSAPHVAGAIALLYENRPSMMLKPAIVKSLLATTVNPASSHRYKTTSLGYRYYGAGLLDIHSLIDVTNDHNYYSSTVTSSNNIKEYDMDIYSPNSTVRVALSFLKNNSASGSHNSLQNISNPNIQDLDLRIYDPNGTLIAITTSYNSNVEIVEFTAAQAGTYTIRVNKIVNTYTDPVTFGVSWRELS